jgi:hypothetical protein
VRYAASGCPPYDTAVPEARSSVSTHPAAARSGPVVAAISETPFPLVRGAKVALEEAGTRRLYSRDPRHDLPKYDKFGLQSPGKAGGLNH